MLSSFDLLLLNSISSCHLKSSLLQVWSFEYYELDTLWCGDRVWTGKRLVWIVKWSHSVVSNSLRPHGHQAPSMGFSRQEYWSGLPFPSPGNFPTQGSNPGLPHCRQTLSVWATREVYYFIMEGTHNSVCEEQEEKMVKGPDMKEDDRNGSFHMWDNWINSIQS